MPTHRRRRFIHGQTAWMLASALALVLLDTLTLELFFVLSLIGFLVITEDPTRRVPTSTLLELARERLSDGDTDQAIGLAYVAVRSHFATTDRPGWTHWEFYNEAATDLGDAERDTLLSITEQFERAVFAPVSIPETAAEAVISAAEHLIDDGQDQSSQPSTQAAD